MLTTLGEWHKCDQELIEGILCKMPTFVLPGWDRQYSIEDCGENFKIKVQSSQATAIDSFIEGYLLRNSE